MKTEVKVIQTVELEFGTVSLRNDDVLTFKPTGAKTIRLDELQLLLDTFLEVTGGNRKKLLSDNRDYQYLGYSERKYIGDNLHRFAIASAVIENNPFVRFIGHTINSFFTPKVPMQMFKSEEEALEWLLNSNDF